MKDDKYPSGLEQLEQLEKKVARLAEMFDATRGERDELRKEVAHLRQRLIEHDRALRGVQSRYERLQKQRDSALTRLERVLEQVDSLAAGAEA